MFCHLLLCLAISRCVIPLQGHRRTMPGVCESSDPWMLDFHLGADVFSDVFKYLWRMNIYQKRSLCEYTRKTYCIMATIFPRLALCFLSPGSNVALAHYFFNNGPVAWRSPAWGVSSFPGYTCMFTHHKNLSKQSALSRSISHASSLLTSPCFPSSVRELMRLHSLDELNKNQSSGTRVRLNYTTTLHAFLLALLTMTFFSFSDHRRAGRW